MAVALSLAKAGDTVALATPARRGHYVGNWSVATKGTSSSAPITIKPAPGVTNPVLDGNHGKATGCHTKACDGPVLTIGSKVHVDIHGLTIQDGDNTFDGYGGAINNLVGGTLSVSACTFLRDTAADGGAIDNADKNGTDTLTVSGSAFTANTATGSAGATQDGGAIDNADNGGTGTLTVSRSTFTANTATVSRGNTDDGGAIDNADNTGTGTLTVSGSTFTANTAGYGAGVNLRGGSFDGGAIDNGDNGGTGTLTVSGSTFTANSARTCPASCPGGGGAIDSGESGAGTLAVSASRFTGNSAHYGGAIVNGTGTASVSGSVFSANTADYAAALDNGDAGTGTLTVSASTFSANRANEDGGAIMNGWTGNSGTVIVSASTFFGNSAAGNPKDPDIDNGGPNGYGGAIDNNGTGTLAVSGSTFSANTAKNGGGGTTNNFGSLWAAADIFNGPCHEAAGATWNDEGYNVGKDASCLKAGTGDVSHGAGHLGRLAHNGGPTETMLPLAGNPALGVVPLNTNVKLNGRSIKLCPTIDQRGVHSPAGKACNAGAVQSPA